MLMKEMRVQDAVGQTLCHDVPRIVRGQKLDPLFRRGHVVTREDVQPMLDSGNANVFIWEPSPGMLHENEAAAMLYGICRSEYMHAAEIEEGMVQLIADTDGVLLVERDRLNAINALGEIVVASRHGKIPVRKGDVIAGIRVVPLAIREDKIDLARGAALGGPVFRICPFRHRRIGIMTTGSEVFRGRVEDQFTPVVEKKLAEYDTEVVLHKVTDDNISIQIHAMQQMLEKHVDLIICTGGMSVSADDRTPHSIRVVSDRVVAYGVPAIPGAMFMLAYTGEDIPIVGLPSCVMFSNRTVFDLVLPLLLAGVPVTEQDLMLMGEGGMCLNCKTCVFPNCGFGKH